MQTQLFPISLKCQILKTKTKKKTGGQPTCTQWGTMYKQNLIEPSAKVCQPVPKSSQERHACLGFVFFIRLILETHVPLEKTFMPEIQVKSHNTQVLLYYCNFTKNWNSSQKRLQN